MLLSKPEITKMFRKAAQVWNENKDYLSEIDSRFGDGDHGVTIGKIAGLIEKSLDGWDDDDVETFLEDLGDNTMEIGGGSAGPLYGTMIGGLSGPLEGNKPIDAGTLKEMFTECLSAMEDITNAGVGDKTMMDALIPAVEAAQSAEDDVMAVLEGVIRIAIFIAYIKLVSRMEDIRRTFMYHGAEHKCINCVEHGHPLTVENVRASSKEHKRCGTSFILIVMIISILFFMVIRIDNIGLRMLSRIILIPVIAGVSYEILQLAGRSNSKFMDLVSRPGMWMQGLTTTEPDDSMIEVAIAATEAVFDWKEYLKENFPETKL